MSGFSLCSIRKGQVSRQHRYSFFAFQPWLITSQWNRPKQRLYLARDRVEDEDLAVLCGYQCQRTENSSRRKSLHFSITTKHKINTQDYDQFLNP
ncbi:hypothetical protein RRG08_022757 [Elysia crispata]|uniref:Uncharacterized protein n=1 Tax=Elysia crispata TaxID=231223 RepID=A0AAE0ZX69_9GAST|nr:hypothetical protein RRG08_022757 [Elysia crispata]